MEENEERIILHPDTEHNSTLIWLHGFGHSVKKYGVKVFIESDNLLPHDCKVILPKAPEGGSWYPVNG
jgi:predicted esterase